MNATTKHTPGPWTVVNDPDQPGFCHIESASQTIACEVDDENAALIAASPTMYAALERAAHALSVAFDATQDPAIGYVEVAVLAALSLARGS